MSNILEDLAKLKQIQSGNTVKNKLEVYPKPKVTPKIERPKIDNKLVWKLFKKYMPAGFVINDTNKEIIYTLLLYFLQDPSFDRYGNIKNEASLEKGILIHGDYGVGKTQLFSIIRSIGKELCEFNYTDFWFSQISAGSFVDQYMKATKSYGVDFDLDKYYRGKLYIDDLGHEKKAFNRDEIFADILFERNRNRSKTFVTTNLNPTDLSDKYGERIGDRLLEMFNIIHWKGESFR